MGRTKLSGTTVIITINSHYEGEMAREGAMG